MDRIRQRRRRGFALGAGLLVVGSGMVVFALATDVTLDTREWLPFYLYVGGLLVAVAGWAVIERVKRVCRRARIAQRARQTVMWRNGASRWEVAGHFRTDHRGRLHWINPRPPWPWA